MPCIATVMKWARDFPDFTEQYARAREALQEHWAEEILDIADDSTNDWVDREVKGGRHVRSLDEERVSRARLRIDSRKWLLSKLAPKKYGDKIDLTHQNPDGSNLIPPTFGISWADGGPGQPAAANSAAGLESSESIGDGGTSSAETP